jgi:hypothetical protein
MALGSAASQVALGALALGCAVLCVGVAGLLRRITDVKLSLGGYTESRPFIVDIGRRLPDDVIDAIADPQADALIVIGSTSCDACRGVLADIDTLPGQILVGIVRDPAAGDEELEIGSHASRLSDGITEAFVHSFDLTQVPVAIAQRDGFVVGAAYGRDIESAEKLGVFWRNFDVPVMGVAR